MTNPNDPASSVRTWARDFEEMHIGLTKREYFAAMALHGLCSQPIFIGSLTQRAVEMADDLIVELSK